MCLRLCFFLIKITSLTQNIPKPLRSLWVSSQHNGSCVSRLGSNHAMSHGLQCPNSRLTRQPFAARNLSRCFAVRTQICASESPVCKAQETDCGLVCLVLRAKKLFGLTAKRVIASPRPLARFRQVSGIRKPGTQRTRGRDLAAMEKKGQQSGVQPKNCLAGFGHLQFAFATH